jgi:probable HAF family extracellular repeat protein
MMRMSTRFAGILSLAICLLVSGLPARAGSMPSYTVTDLPVLAGYSSDNVLALNDAGQVLGYALNPVGPGVPFVYSNGQSSPAQSQSATAIDNTGHSVNTGSFSSSGVYYVSQQIDGMIQKNGTTDGFDVHGGTLTPLPTAGPGSASFAAAVNNSGLAVGYINSGGSSQPVVFSGNQIVPLTVPQGFSTYSGLQINNSGQIAGIATGHNAQGSFISQAFLSSGGKLVDLGTLGGPQNSLYGLNDAGQVVGNAYTATGSLHAFLYQNGQMLDLNNLIGSDNSLTLTEARGINNQGQIAVDGVDSQGVEHALLLTPQPVPEPSTIALWGIFGLAIAYRIRRRVRCCPLAGSVGFGVRSGSASV